MVPGELCQLRGPPLGFDVASVLGKGQAFFQALQAALLHDLDSAGRFLRLTGAASHRERLQVESFVLPASHLPHDGLRGGRGDSAAF